MKTTNNKNIRTIMKKLSKKRFLGLPIFLAVFAAASAVLMLLWNWLIPSIIGWSAVTYWQSAGLLLMCKMLFGGFGRMGHGHPGFKKGFHRHHPMFTPDEKAEMRERIRNMSYEERREYIRRQMCGFPQEKPADNANDGR